MCRTVCRPARRRENQPALWPEDEPERREKEGQAMSECTFPEYQKRMIVEFNELKERHEKLRDMCNRIEAAEMMQEAGKPIEEPPHDCPLYLLRDQQKIMGEYLHVLELRAIIEGVDLHTAKGE